MTAPPSLADAGLAVVSLLKSGHVREAEFVTAFLALWRVQRVERGTTSRENANEVFTQLAASISRDQAAPLSDAWRELVTEAEHFHHFGEEWGADPAKVRRLANKIIQVPDANG